MLLMVPVFPPLWPGVRQGLFISLIQKQFSVFISSSSVQKEPSYLQLFEYLLQLFFNALKGVNVFAQNRQLKTLLIDWHICQELQTRYFSDKHIFLEQKLLKSNLILPVIPKQIGIAVFCLYFRQKRSSVSKFTHPSFEIVNQCISCV